jgi:hypothetical protein
MPEEDLHAPEADHAEKILDVISVITDFSVSHGNPEKRLSLPYLSHSSKNESQNTLNYL